MAESKFPGQIRSAAVCIGPADGPGHDRWRGWKCEAGVADGEPNGCRLQATAQWRLFVDRSLWLVVRTRGDSAELASAIRQAIWSVDKDQPIIRVARMDQLLAASAAERRFALILFEAFGFAALVLVATGLYGVVSASVTERTREIGVRLALGAQRRNVLALILRQGLTLTLSGVSIGLLAS